MFQLTPFMSQLTPFHVTNPIFNVSTSPISIKPCCTDPSLNHKIADKCSVHVYIHVYKVYRVRTAVSDTLLVPRMMNRYSESTKIQSEHQKLNKPACVDFLCKMGSCITQLAFARCSHMIQN